MSRGEFRRMLGRWSGLGSGRDVAKSPVESEVGKDAVNIINDPHRAADQISALLGFFTLKEKVRAEVFRAQARISFQHNEDDPSGGGQEGALVTQLDLDASNHTFWVNRNGDVFYDSPKESNKRKAKQLGFRLGTMSDARAALKAEEEAPK